MGPWFIKWPSCCIKEDLKLPIETMKSQGNCLHMQIIKWELGSFSHKLTWNWTCFWNFWSWKKSSLRLHFSYLAALSIFFTISGKIDHFHVWYHSLFTMWHVHCLCQQVCIWVFVCICICFECFCEDLCDSIQPLRDTLVLEVKQRKLAISKFTRDFRLPPSAEVSSEFVCPQLDLRLPHHHARFVPSLLWINIWTSSTTWCNWVQHFVCLLLHLQNHEGISDSVSLFLCQVTFIQMFPFSLQIQTQEIYLLISVSATKQTTLDYLT